MGAFYSLTIMMWFSFCNVPALCCFHFRCSMFFLCFQITKMFTFLVVHPRHNIGAQYQSHRIQIQIGLATVFSSWRFLFNIDINTEIKNWSTSYTTGRKLKRKRKPHGDGKFSRNFPVMLFKCLQERVECPLVEIARILRIRLMCVIREMYAFLGQRYLTPRSLHRTLNWWALSFPCNVRASKKLR